MIQIDQVYYRFQQMRYAAPLDEWENPSGPGRLTINLEKWPVEKVTPQGVRIIGGKLILHRHRKKFACATVEEAKQCFIARKKRQIAILSAQLNDAKEALSIIEKHSC